jgi:hypothetical protein
MIPVLSSLFDLLSSDPAEILFFIVAMYAIGFGWAWFAEQAKGLTGTVSCKCGKRTVTGIAPRAHPDFTKLLSANCPSCAAVVSAVPSSAPPASSLQPTACSLQPAVSSLGDHDGE